jgi:outer membrane lipoprotein-sorting protein
VFLKEGERSLVEQMKYEINRRLALLPAIILLIASVNVRAEDAKADISLPDIKPIPAEQIRLSLAKDNPMLFLDQAIKNYQSTIKDYTCTFIKQEMVRGKLTEEQKIKVKFREGPFAVFMQWVENPTLVDRVLYVKGHNDDQAMVKPAGFLGWFVRSHVNRPVNSPDAAKVSRRRLDQFGFDNALKLIRDANKRAETKGELRFAFSGASTFNNRPTYVFERFLPDKPEYPDQHMIVHIDQKWLVPLSTTCYDARGRLLGKYVFQDVNLNVGLSFKEFTADANGL